MARPVLLVTTRHRPHEQLLLGWSALLGVGYLTDPAAVPSSVERFLPPGAVPLWAAALVLSGLAGLAGCWWRGERGMGLEIGGLLINTGAVLIMAAAAFTAGASARAAWAGGVVVAWAAANVWRAVQLRADLRQIRRTERRAER